MKRRDSWVFLLIILVLFMFVSGCSTGEAHRTSKVLPAYDESKCIDSDNGINLEEKGTTKGKYGWSFASKTDFCDRAGKLTEFYCSKNKVQKVTKDCKELGEDYVCKDSICQVPPIEFGEPQKLLGGQFTEVKVNPANSQYVYAVSFNGWGANPLTLHFSEDSGQSFEPSGNFSYFAIDKISPQIVYAVDNQELYVSLDYGKNFEFFHQFDQAIAKIFPDRFESTKVYFGTGSSPSQDWIYYLFEDGDFEQINLSEHLSVPDDEKKYVDERIIWDIDQSRNDPDILYFVSEDGDHTDYVFGSGGEFSKYFLIRTLDGGSSYQTYSQGLPWHPIQVVSFVDGNNQDKWITNVEGNHLYFFNDNANSWISKMTSEGPYFDKYYRNYYVHSDGNHYFAVPYLDNDGTEIGSVIKRSTDNGENWEILIELIDYDEVYSFDFDPQGNLYFTDYEKGLFKVEI